MLIIAIIAIYLVATIALAIHEDIQKHKPKPPDPRTLEKLKKAAEKDRKNAARLELLRMDIEHYSKQYESLNHSLKDSPRKQEQLYRLERKIAAAVLESERLEKSSA